MAIKYQILRMETVGTPPVLHRGAPVVFNDPVDAARMAKEYSAAYGEKMCAKPIINDEWREREDTKFRDGTYRQLPWAAANWWNCAYPIWKDHYPHASLEKPGWIAFTKDAADGARDKQTLLRPGAYLNRYFEKAMHDYGLRDRLLVDQFMTMYGPIEVKFATTEAEIVKVYDLFRTCMAGKCWPKNIHPATTYIAGDLQVAYLGDLDAHKVAARSLVWPAKKLHSRVYGDIARLTQGLARLDYKWGAPIGAKIKRIPLRELNFNGGDNPAGCFLVPYIDKQNQAGGGHLSVRDAGDHLVICTEGETGSHHAGQADGYSGYYIPREDEFPTFACYRCAKKGFRKITPVYGSVPDGDEDEDDEGAQSWCDACLRRNSWLCGYSQRRFTLDVPYIYVRGDTWAKYYAKMYAGVCEGNGDLYPKDNLYEVWLSATKSKRYSDDYIGNNITGGTYTSYLTQRRFPRKELAYIRDTWGDQRYCAKWELTTRAFQCDGCDGHRLIETRFQSCGDDRLFCDNCNAKIIAGKKTPVSENRKAFEAERDQLKLGAKPDGQAPEKLAPKAAAAIRAKMAKAYYLDDERY